MYERADLYETSETLAFAILGRLVWIDASDLLRFGILKEA